MPDAPQETVPEAAASPADRPALREEIAEALMCWAERHNNPMYGPIRRPGTVTQNAYGRADAVLAVIESRLTDRAVLIREVTERLETRARQAPAPGARLHSFRDVARVLIAELHDMADEAPLSRFYSHEECGFHWHGRDGLDIPMRDGQPICPRCELERLMLADVVPAAADEDDDELVCVDECGSCDACGMEVFGTPAEGWREAARFLRRTARQSADRQGAIHGARLIEAELRRIAETTPEAEVTS